MGVVGVGETGDGGTTVVVIVRGKGYSLRSTSLPLVDLSRGWFNVGGGGARALDEENDASGLSRDAVATFGEVGDGETSVDAE